jgi:hypothetical protein
LAWLKNENGDLYQPSYADVLRVAFTKEFERGRMKELVGLLSGRNFETRSFEKDIMDESFTKLSQAVIDFANETNFQRFLMILKSAGFIDSYMINSQNVINVTYAIFLKLREMKLDNNDIEKWVQKWFVMSILTGRYSGSPESKIDKDIKAIAKKGIEKVLEDIEESRLSDAFWNAELVQDLDRSLTNAPALQVFFASQVKNNTKGFLSKDITVASLILHKGDIHHLFPKKYLKKRYKQRGDYNQIANYVYTQSEINIKIGNKSPKEYFTELLEQCKTGEAIYGRIVDKQELIQNLRDHAIPLEIFEMTLDDYPEFLDSRIKLIAKKIEAYYKSLTGIQEDEERRFNYLQMIENGENDKVEFKAGMGWSIKEDRGEYSLEHAAVKTITAFLNTSGGTLFIGVEDNGNVVGIKQDVAECGKKNHDSYLLRLNNLINSAVGKKMSQYLQQRIIKLDSKYVCRVDVLPSPKPVFLKRKNKKYFYIRSSAATEPLDVEETSAYIEEHWD